MMSCMAPPGLLRNATQIYPLVSYMTPPSTLSVELNFQTHSKKKIYFKKVQLSKTEFKTLSKKLNFENYLKVELEKI